MPRTYAGILGCLAMVLVLVRSIWIGIDLDAAAANAMLALIVFAIIGGVLGQVAETTIVEAVRFKLEQEIETNSKSHQSSPTNRAA